MSYAVRGIANFPNIDGHGSLSVQCLTVVPHNIDYNYQIDADTMPHDVSWVRYGCYRASRVLTRSFMVGHKAAWCSYRLCYHNMDVFGTDQQLRRLLVAAAFVVAKDLSHEHDPSMEVTKSNCR